MRLIIKNAIHHKTHSITTSSKIIIVSRDQQSLTCNLIKSYNNHTQSFHNLIIFVREHDCKMNSKHFAVFVALVLLAIGTTVQGDDDYVYLSTCDERCEIRNRVNPFAESCDNCCRARNFQKGKCGGFGWRYCKCKRQSQLRNLLNSILNSNNY
ncbi:unnamed protein product [Orchesella dallaii]|uniref:Uncharacterized protein n=1 Tax=Orchesella dallaii TaxID=48710 RepID=A0ABP1RYK2_9HEXA